jgi:hypothetical protein
MAYTTIDDPSAYFHTQLYTGDGASTNAITNDANAGDFQPDWIWIKRRDGADNQHVFDTSRGITKELNPNGTGAEGSGTNLVKSSDTDGFTLGDNGGVNGSSETYVAWQWKANGGTTTTNDASATGVGSIDSVYQANTTAGFSIVTHTGSGSSGTIAHGLGTTPKWVLTKNRTDGSEDWANYHVGLSSAEYYIRLNTTAAQAAGSSVWGDTAPSSTVITLGGANGKNNASSKNYVSYCFADIQGYSKFGSYTGNGNEDGPFVYTGFKPQWILFKNRGAAEEWVLQDTTRNPNNPVTKNIRADSDIAEADASALDIDFLSNGFKNRSDNAQLNSSGVVYIYMAFAEHPFVSSKGVPTTAR